MKVDGHNLDALTFGGFGGVPVGGTVFLLFQSAKDY